MNQTRIRWSPLIVCVPLQVRSPVCAQVVVLVLDELDYLVTRTQSIIYNLFEWASSVHSSFVVVGISNTIDLPERLLPRVHSRLCIRRVNFLPYKHVEIAKIIADRIGGLAVFEPDGVLLCARKVAAVSGDVRRALEASLLHSPLHVPRSACHSVRIPPLCIRRTDLRLIAKLLSSTHTSPPPPPSRAHHTVRTPKSPTPLWPRQAVPHLSFFTHHSVHPAPPSPLLRSRPCSVCTMLESTPAPPRPAFLAFHRPPWFRRCVDSRRNLQNAKS